ncbi:hypothetical protein HHK36_002427 [Tetracentron sinense]|uniref:Methyltransferase-like protein 2 n=1 Tax=Tetracentron sinense TaxID=13715 RepID=A0A835DMU4_TETSI|nr:hypothetical protein HHK36_002427 [Tetracentron sinense]
MGLLEMSDQLSLFSKSGFYRFESTNSIFIDPVRILNCSYTRFRVSPSAYYSRFFESKDVEETRVSPSANSKKRKRKKKKSLALNEREQSADHRHQEARPLLLRAHEALLDSTDLLSSLCDLKRDFCSSNESKDVSPCVEKPVEQSFVELGSVWQAPLYEISLHFNPQNKQIEDEGSPIDQYGEREVVPIFNNLVVNETNDDAEAEFLYSQYIIPRDSRFYMTASHVSFCFLFIMWKSDLRQIQNLIPAEPDHGFNLIVIDPPWENRAARQKSVYPTLPNRYFLSLPVKQLTHTEGALVALWVTNREKLRVFVEKELFPSWGVRYVATFYWLKVKADGSLIGELDLFHHRPYECLLMGYCHGEVMDPNCQLSFRCPQDNQVIISVPGDYSRKPPIGSIQALTYY